jgi:hypothetical protein
MKVMLAKDGSPHSQAALVEFARQPWPNGTEVQILTVIHPSFPLVMDPLFIGVSAHVQQAKDGPWICCRRRRRESTMFGSGGSRKAPSPQQ